MLEQTTEKQVDKMMSESAMTDMTLSASEVRELIARRAYDIYTHRGTGFGDELSDWLRAEVEITLLLADPREIAEEGKRNGQPAARKSLARGVARGVMKAGNWAQPRVSRLPKRKNVLKSNPA